MATKSNNNNVTGFSVSMSCIKQLEFHSVSIKKVMYLSHNEFCCILSYYLFVQITLMLYSGLFFNINTKCDIRTDFPKSGHK